jgi:hypothetical protein
MRITIPGSGAIIPVAIGKAATMFADEVEVDIPDVSAIVAVASLLGQDEAASIAHVEGQGAAAIKATDRGPNVKANGQRGASREYGGTREATPAEIAAAAAKIPAAFAARRAQALAIYEDTLARIAADETMVKNFIAVAQEETS